MTTAHRSPPPRHSADRARAVGVAYVVAADHAWRARAGAPADLARLAAGAALAADRAADAWRVVEREALAGRPPTPARAFDPRLGEWFRDAGICPSCGERALDGKVTCGRASCGSSTGQDR
jgi:hypothetical protein